MTKVSFLCALLTTALLPSLASAQTFDAAMLKVGQKVDVHDVRGATTTGTVTRVSASSIDIDQPRGRRRQIESRSFDVAEVQTVRKHDSTANGFFIGLGAGYAVGQITVSALCPNDPECATNVAVYLGIPVAAGGAALGALVDFAIRKTLFQGPGLKPSVSIAPIVGRGTGGAALSMRF